MIGTSLHHYRITGRLGAGGMGEVYRAEDGKLGREVAIKVLPAHFATDAQRLARFDREARALAALNHPHIAAIYGVDQADGISYLVMEYVPGEELRGPLPVDEALRTAAQIADGLEAAHEKGLIHRDLKPGNIRVTPQGKVKVLDFGLAKAQDTDSINDLSHTPTLSLSGSFGVVLGTAAYMSPEQARGRTLDRRTDIWSFGCVLYEVLTGRKAYSGDTTSDTIATILRSEPDWQALPAETPARIRELLRRCLQKDPQKRLRDIGDARLEIESALEELANPQAATVARAVPTVGRKAAALTAIAAVLVIAAALGAWWLRGKLQPQQMSRSVQVHRLTDTVGPDHFPAISPDGKSVAFVAQFEGYRHIWVRLLSGGAPLRITTDAREHLLPRWSPDSSGLLYYSPESGQMQGALWEVSALGGSPRRIVSALNGADISHDGQRLAFFRLAKSAIELVVTARDGSNERVIATFPMQNNYSFPRWSPDGRWIAYQAGFVFGYDVFMVPADGGEARRLTFDSMPMAGLAWVPDGSGIVYSTARANTMLYLPLLQLWRKNIDDPEPVQLTFGSISYLFPDVGANGQIAASQTFLNFDIWKYPIDGSAAENVRRGVAITEQTGHVQTPSVSPDESEIVYLSDTGSRSNLWVMDLKTRVTRQITNEPEAEVAVGVPVWSPKGKLITHFRRRLGQRQGEQWLVDSDGSNPRRIDPMGGWGDWSPDGEWIYYANSEQQNGVYVMKKMRVSSGEVVTVRSDDAQAPAIGPDGTLYFVKSLAGVNGLSSFEIHVARPEGAASRVLTQIPGRRIAPWQLVQPVASPDGKWLAVLLTDGVATNIWGISTADGSLRQFTDFGDRNTLIARRISWSRDSRWIYAAVGESESDVALLLGALPGGRTK